MAARAVKPEGGVGPDSRVWRLGWKYVMLWCLMPVFIVAITQASMAMQDGPAGEHGRFRFGEQAYWKQTARLLGDWKVVGMSAGLEAAPEMTGDVPLTGMNFGIYRSVESTQADGTVLNTSRWFLKNQYIWLQWKDGEYAETPLQFREQRLYIAWPPHSPSGKYLVLERVE